MRANRSQTILCLTYIKVYPIRSGTCKYHVIIVPKNRKSIIYGKIRTELKKILHELATQKECQITEGNLSIDHVHMCIEIPPKHAVSLIPGFLKGKSAIAIARMQGKDRNYTGAHFWARGYAVSTVGFDEEIVKKIFRNQFIVKMKSLTRE